MARQPRILLPGLPHHITQRGNDRQPCFFESEQYNSYLEMLADAATKECCAVHAYVLMTNHIHLLVTPESANGISRLMQCLGRRYVRHVNARFGRTGTLWEGRYKSTVVGTDEYVLACYRYIELNPVRAQMVIQPYDYPWSSHRFNANGEYNPLLRPHDAYTALAATGIARTHTCRTLFDSDFSEEAAAEIRTATRRGLPYGDQRFRTQVEEMLGRRLSENSWGGARRTAKKTS